MSAGPAGFPETLTVALDEPVDLRLNSETLIRLDCNGEVRPGLATEWASDSTGRRWTLTLPRLPADEVVSTWGERGPTVRALGIDSVVALDHHKLSVTLRATPDSAPRLFADPALAIPTPEHESGLQLRVTPEKDPRDALDHAVDLVVTRDPAVVEYVAHRPEFTSFTLPWSRVYVLIQPAGALPISGLDVDSVRRSLAKDVAQADARAAEPPFWWSTRWCPSIPLSYTVPPPLSPRIVYPRGDPVARGLAERIVALAKEPAPLTAAGLNPAEFDVALRSQRDRGHVVGLPREVAAPCHRLTELPGGAFIDPLIETRAHAILRKGSPPLTAEWDGTLRVVEP